MDSSSNNNVKQKPEKQIYNFVNKKECFELNHSKMKILSIFFLLLFVSQLMQAQKKNFSHHENEISIWKFCSCIICYVWNFQCGKPQQLTSSSSPFFRVVLFTKLCCEFSFPSGDSLFLYIGTCVVYISSNSHKPTSYWTRNCNHWHRKTGLKLKTTKLNSNINISLEQLSRSVL